MVYRITQYLAVMIILSVHLFSGDSLIVVGRVVDLAGQPVFHLTVETGGISSLTDNNGEYQLVIPNSCLPVDEFKDNPEVIQNGQITIFNLIGQKVYEQKICNQLLNHFTLQGVADNGINLASGFYLAVLRVGNKIVQKNKISIIDGNMSHARLFVEPFKQLHLSKSLAYTLEISVRGAHILDIENQTVEVDLNEMTLTGEVETIAVDRFPTAGFSVAKGENQRHIIFDASVSEDDDNRLKYRWDWENDGLWDTNFMISSQQEHQYPSSGEFVVRLEVKDYAGQTDDTTQTVSCSNTVPMPIFSVSPDSGYLDTEFLFDGNLSLDSDEGNENLQVRWDFESDGIWDTEFSSEKISSHRYNSAGLYLVTMQIVDSEEETDEADRTIKVHYVYDHFVTLLDRWIVQLYGFPGNGCNMVPENVKVENSHLCLEVTFNDNATLPMKYNGGEIGDTTFFTYGYFETRMKPGIMSGSVGSFFLMNKFEIENWEHKEIDIEFIGKHPTSMQMTTHDYQNGGLDHKFSTTTKDLGFDIRECFHDYGILWTPDSVSWFVDGKLFHTETQYVPHEPLHIRMNNWAGDMSVDGISLWLGEIDESQIPTSVEYQWIKIIPITEYFNND
ncbi:MAG: family 16 glycosylhydrolase [Candidatus Marinimicrobia bacterium]|nr:family 16 glycosylhydrolase [Candidatus Neomarinimicrobiota bacterium]